MPTDCEDAGGTHIRNLPALPFLSPIQLHLICVLGGCFLSSPSPPPVHTLKKEEGGLFASSHFEGMVCSQSQKGKKRTAPSYPESRHGWQQIEGGGLFALWVLGGKSRLVLSKPGWAAFLPPRKSWAAKSILFSSFPPRAKKEGGSLRRTEKAAAVGTKKGEWGIVGGQKLPSPFFFFFRFSVSPPSSPPPSLSLYPPLRYLSPLPRPPMER